MSSEAQPVDSGLDFRGNYIHKGDTILYPRMSGRSVEMTEATVLEVKAYLDNKNVQNENFDSDRPTGPDNPRWVWKEVTRYKYQVQPTRSTRNFYRSGIYSFDEEGIRPVWIQIGENVVKA